MSQYFPKRYKPFERDINVKFDLSNSAKIADLKDETRIDTSNFPLKSNLASLKTEADKTDVWKLKTGPADLSKLSNVVNNDVFKKAVYDKLVGKVNNIDISGFDIKTKYDRDKSDLEKKINDADKKLPAKSGLAEKQI